MIFWKKRPSRSAEGSAAEDAPDIEPDIEIETSVCTGERLIGIRNKRTGKLDQAVFVRSQKDIDDYRRAHR